MSEGRFDPLRVLVDRLCCRVYLDGGGNVRLAFSKKHGLADMMTAQGIVRSNATVLRDQLRDGQSLPGPICESEEASWSGRFVNGPFCPLF
jgi:hypothetical protein